MKFLQREGLRVEPPGGVGRGGGILDGQVRFFVMFVFKENPQLISCASSSSIDNQTCLARIPLKTSTQAVEEKKALCHSQA